MPAFVLRLQNNKHRSEWQPVRRVRRIIRKVDPWTTLKVSALMWAVLGLAFVLGMVIFWSVIDRAGLPDRLVDFMVEITLIEEGSDPFGNTEQFLASSSSRQWSDGYFSPVRVSLRQLSTTWFQMS